MTTTDKTGYTNRLRALADLLDDHPDIPVPYALNSSGLQWYVHHDIDTVLAIRALMADAVTGPYDSVRGNFPVEVTGTLVGLATSVLVAKEIALDYTMPAVFTMNPRLLAHVPFTDS